LQQARGMGHIVVVDILEKGYVFSKMVEKLGIQFLAHTN